MAEMRNSYRIFVEEKRLLGRPGCRWEDNIRMDFREITWTRVAWVHLAQDKHRLRAVVNTVMNLWEP
jgi:hypothetical protein